MLLAVVCLAAVSLCAEDITDATDFLPSDGMITDGDERTVVTYPQGSTLTLKSDDVISAVYIKFDRLPSEWTLSAGGRSVRCGRYGFLHEYCDVAALLGETHEVTLTFDGADTEVCDIFVFSGDDIPDWVQRWEPAEGDADLVLLSTHADDEQLFLLGVLPYYAGEMGYQVQVIYFTNHWAVRDRPHEQLNGLWTVGVTRYPVISELPDGWNGVARDMKNAYRSAVANGFTRDRLVELQVEYLRRFRPQVVVGHDPNGEYGHPQHIINTETLMDALTLAADPTYSEETAADYGVWDVPKTYLHLYGENRITMDWDRPLARFGGKTAYEMSKLGFACHRSQHYTWFSDWLSGARGNYTKATDIKKYSPTEYGLYRTTVGADTGVGGWDFFENLTVRSTETSEIDGSETVPSVGPVRVPARDTAPATEPDSTPTTEPVPDPMTDGQTTAAETLPTADTESETAGTSDNGTKGGTAPATGDERKTAAVFVAAIMIVSLAAAAYAAAVRTGKSGKANNR